MIINIILLIFWLLAIFLVGNNYKLIGRSKMLNFICLLWIGIFIIKDMLNSLKIISADVSLFLSNIGILIMVFSLVGLFIEHFIYKSKTKAF